MLKLIEDADIELVSGTLFADQIGQSMLIVFVIREF